MNNQFPKGFLWGASTSDIQIEGASRLYGKGETIWDRYCQEPGRILNGDNPDIACDHYHRFKEDIELMCEIGLKAYRLSISWARIFPEGKGKINKAGIQFYRALLELLISKNIRPVVTLHHWGFPQAMQDIGGWANQDMSAYFEDYARCLFENFSDLVDTWITHNEPIGTSYLGYFKGYVAPGVRDFYTSVLVNNNLLLSHAKAVKAFRALGNKGEIGITLNFHPAIPVSNTLDDLDAAQRIGLYFDKWFADAIFKGEYPNELMNYFKEQNIDIPLLTEKDFKEIAQPIDFLGVNYYYPHYVKYDTNDWPFKATFSPYSKDKNHTYTGWDIYPEGLYKTLKTIQSEYGNRKILITENGAAFNDYPNFKGEVHDYNRIDFLTQHIQMVKKCIDEGLDIKGYFIWSLMDNFEWVYGYSQRFGLTYIDNITKERTLKKSAYWYRKIIQSNGLINE